MTIAAVKREYHTNEKITDIDNFVDLKKYACSKVGYLKEWYLKCVDCPQQKNCTAGKQAVKLIESTTAPKKQEIPNPKNNLRGYIEWVFTQKDPVKVMLENTAQNVKPQSVYQRVHLWKKNNPDLEERFHMLEKFRFLWNKPWDQMRIPDILKKMYPEDSKTDVKQDIPEVNPPEAAFKQWKADSVPEKAIEENEVALEDYLAELRSSTNKDPEPVVKEPVKDTEEAVHMEPVDFTGQADLENENPAGQSISGTDPGQLDILLKKLRDNITEYEQKIQQIQEKISAILTVQEMMRNGV